MRAFHKKHLTAWYGYLRVVKVIFGWTGLRCIALG